MHNFFPGDMMKTVLIPIVKDKNESLASSDNYRPIAITSVLSKVFELLLLQRNESYLHTTANQFGFKAKHSTDMAIYSLGILPSIMLLVYAKQSCLYMFSRR